MKRRDFLRNALLPAVGASGLSGAWLEQAAAQGRKLRAIPPVEPPAAKRIIDMHVHAWFQDDKPDEPLFAPVVNNSRPDATYQINAGWEQFQYDLDVVHKGCLLHIARGDAGKKGNDRIVEITKRWPEKLIPFGSVNPLFADALDEFKRAVEVLGVKGFKLSPIYHGFHPMDPASSGFTPKPRNGASRLSFTRPRLKRRTSLEVGRSDSV